MCIFTSFAKMGNGTSNTKTKIRNSSLTRREVLAKEIAQRIGKDKSDISRELRRSNTPESGTFFTYSKSLPDTDNYTRFLDYKMPFLPLEYHGNL